MLDVLRMTWLEYKKIFCKKNIYLWFGAFIFLVWSLINKISDLKFGLKNMGHIKMFPAGYFIVVMFFYCVNFLLEEYYRGTAIFLFTSGMPRWKILLIKILAMGLFGGTLGLINYLFDVCFELKFGAGDFLGEFGIIFVYLIFAWMLSNYFLLVTVIFKSRFISFLVGLFFLNVMFDLSNAMRKFGGLINKNFFELNPFDGLFMVLLKNNLSFYKAVGFIFFGAIFFYLAVIIFNKKDLN